MASELFCNGWADKLTSNVRSIWSWCIEDKVSGPQEVRS